MESKVTKLCINHGLSLGVRRLIKNGDRKHYQGCALAAAGRGLRRLTFGFGRPKNKTGRPTGHPAVFCAVQHCRKAGD